MDNRSSPEDEQMNNSNEQFQYDCAVIRSAFCLSPFVDNELKLHVPFQETTLKCAIENRFIKTWEKARRDQNDHFNRMLVDSLQNKVNCYAKNIELENRCMVEIETYSLNEMDMHKAESLRWSEKFDVDLNRTEIDIQIATSDLEAMKLNYEKMVEAIRFRVQEMIDFVALKEERATQKDSDLMKLIDEHREHLFAKC